MSKTYSPLRYPGGKTKLYSLIEPIVEGYISQGIYIEPFAGGAGLALALLFNGRVKNIVLNDFDYNIYCFWKSCITQNDDFCELVDTCIINMDNWRKQKLIYSRFLKSTELEIGFATFFLNRCNVSGVINGGPIGGKNQTGKYKLDARFNRSKLIEKIQLIGQYADSIHVYNEDASIFLQEKIKEYPIENTLLNIDPPYVKKGKSLYKNCFEEIDHIELSNVIKDIKHKWLVTYDYCDFIIDLYNQYRSEEIKLQYSAGQTKIGREIMIFSDNILD